MKTSSTAAWRNPSRAERTRTPTRTKRQIEKRTRQIEKRTRQILDLIESQVPPDLVTVAALQGLAIELAEVNALPLIALAAAVAEAAGARLEMVVRASDVEPPDEPDADDQAVH